jgi:hypothetical protein
MKEVISSSGAAEKRWVRLGLLTHSRQEPQNEDRMVHRLSAWSSVSSSWESAEFEQRSFYFLDAARFLGREYECLKSCLSAEIVHRAFVVGDLGCRAEPITGIPKIQLLYEQIPLSEFRFRVKAFESSGFFHGIRCGLLPSSLYATRDALLHPAAVAKILAMRPKLLFAGQSGLISMRNLFLQHGDVREWVDRVSPVVAQLNTEVRVCGSVEHAAKLMLEYTASFTRLLELTTYALTQEQLKIQRHTVVFKSVFRFVLCNLLKNLHLIINLDYSMGFLRVYQSCIYSKHLLIDFGGVNGYEVLYPRSADMLRSGAVFFQLEQEKMLGCQMELSDRQLRCYIESQLAAISILYEKHCGLPLEAG